MNEVASGALHLSRFGVGQSVPRNEDPRLLRGGGYTDDVSLPRQLVAWVRRSDVAHGRIVRLDCEAARAVPASARSSPPPTSMPRATSPCSA